MNIHLISQILGYLSTLTVLFALQQKEMKIILILSIISNVMSSASNLLIGGYAGGCVCALAVIQTVISFRYEWKEKKVPLYVTGIFVAGYIAITVFTYNTILDILPCLAAILYACAIVQKKPLRYRLFIAFNASLWILYELTLPTPNYALAINCSLQLVSTIIGMIRLDRKKKEKEA